MGLDYSFVAICTYSSVDGVLRALARRMDPEARARLESALPWRAAEEAGGLRRGIAGMVGVRDTCVSFVLPRDAAHAAMEHPRIAEPEEREVRVGCVYLDVLVGSWYALVTGTAATTSMSHYFRDSDEMRKLWRYTAVEGGAAAILIDCEDEPWHVEYPRRGLLGLRPSEDESLDRYGFRDLVYDPDRLAAAVLRDLRQDDGREGNEPSR